MMRRKNWFGGLLIWLVSLLLLATVNATEIKPAPRVLLVVTSHSETGPFTLKTGFTYAELADPYWVFTDAGLRVDIASIKGGTPPIDPRSDFPFKIPSGSLARFKADETAQRKLQNTTAIANVKPDDYDAIFLVGGHGTMWDFANNADLTKIGSTLFQQGKVVAAVCHGPAGLLGMTDQAGASIIKGRRITGYTNEEEAGNSYEKILPYLLEPALKEKGALFEKAQRFQPYVVVDKRLVTGQNPASAEPAAKAVLKLLLNK